MRVMTGAKTIGLMLEAPITTRSLGTRARTPRDPLAIVCSGMQGTTRKSDHMEMQEGGKMEGKKSRLTSERLHQ